MKAKSCLNPELSRGSVETTTCSLGKLALDLHVEIIAPRQEGAKEFHLPGSCLFRS